jgi:hypothetical protein
MPVQMETDHALDFVSAPILGQDKLALSRLGLKAERDSRRDGTLRRTVPRNLYFGIAIKVCGKGTPGVWGLGAKKVALSLDRASRL